MKATELGTEQLLVLQVLFGKRRATARQITDAVNRIEPIAHRTVQRLLRGLEQKGSIARAAQGRVFVPSLTKEAFQRHATRDLIHRVFAGNAGSLLAYLPANKRFSREDVDEIRKLIIRRGKK